MKLANIYPAIE